MICILTFFCTLLKKLNMRKLALPLIATCMVSTVAVSQSKETERLLNSIQGQWSLDNNNNVTYQKVIEIPEISKDEIYKRAESYFIYNYGSGKSVIQTRIKKQVLSLQKDFILMFIKLKRRGFCCKIP